MVIKKFRTFCCCRRVKIGRLWELGTFLHTLGMSGIPDNCAKLFGALPLYHLIL